MTHRDGPLFDYVEQKEAQREEAARMMRRPKTLPPAIRKEVDALLNKKFAPLGFPAEEESRPAFSFQNEEGQTYRFRPLLGGQADMAALRRQNIQEFAGVYGMPRVQGAGRIFFNMIDHGMAFWVDREDKKKTETALGLVVAWPGMFRGGNQETFREGALYLNAHWHDYLQRCGKDVPLVLQQACAFIFKTREDIQIVTALARPSSHAAEALEKLQARWGRDYVSNLALGGTCLVDDFDLMGWQSDCHLCHMTRRTKAELLNPPVDRGEKIFDRRRLNYI